MPPLFRRRAATAVEDPEASDPTQDPAASGDDRTAPAQGTDAAEDRQPRGYTPSKRELGHVTPKRPSPHLRRPGATGPARSRKSRTREERRELKQTRREHRREISEKIRRGDPQYLPARDQGPAKAVARDVVDSRRTVGTWFFAFALVILLASASTIPLVVTVANGLFLVLATAVVVDSTLLCRRVKRLVRERHPNTDQRMPGLYLYTVMRAITFRRMRVPLPRLNFGDRA